MSKKQKIGKVKKSTVLSPRIMQELARSEEYKLTGKHIKALDIAEKVLIEDPGCIEAAEEVADNYLSLDRLEEAKKAATHALMLHGGSYIAHFVIGFVASEQEQWDDAVVHFQTSNVGQPNNPEILRCLGWTLFHSGAQEEGVATLLRSLHLRQEDPAILCDLAACYLQLNNFDKSIHLLERAIRVDPSDHRVEELLGVAHRLKKAFSSEMS